MSQYDPLIFGRSQLERVVSIEPLDDKAEVFFENADGSIESKFVDNDYWILAQNKLDRDFKPLKGDLHYKWGKLYKSREKFFIGRNIYKKQDVYSIYNPQESLMVRKGLTYFKGMHPEDVSILSFDLETTGLNPELPDAKVLLISYSFRDVNVIETGLLAFDEYPSQGELIKAFNEVIQRLNPSIICGHNMYSFDVPYLICIAGKENVELLWGRDGSALKQESYSSKYRIDGSRDQEFNKLRCYGRNFLDTYFLALKYDIATKKYPSYGLKVIIKIENLEDTNRVIYDASQIRHNYTNPVEWAKIKKYCEGDADDSLKLFDLMCPAYFYMTQSIPKSFQEVMTGATGSQINSIMVRAYLQDGHSIPKATEAQSYRGAISLGIPGIYRNAVKWDVISEYPSIMREYQVYDKIKDPKAMLIKLVDYFFEKRIFNKTKYKETKDKYYDDQQSSVKILLNSMYGFYGATGLNFNFPAGAAFITMKGRETVSKAISWACGFDVQTLIRADEEEENELSV